MSLYSSSGQINCTVVNGSSYTGLYAGDGSYNVVINSSGTYVGLLHPCGAYNAFVVTDTSKGYYAPNGSINVISNGAGGFYSNNPNLANPNVTVSYTTLDPGSSLLNVTLSNGNLKATAGGSTGGARSISYKSSGKFYFETTIGAAAGANPEMLGVAINNGSTAYGGMANGSPGNYVEYWINSGSILSSGSSTGFNLGISTAGDRIDIAVDIGNLNTWFRRNGGLWNNNVTSNPVTNTNGAAIPLAGSYSPAIAYFSGNNGDNVTFNFGSTAFVGTPPTGFTGWPA